METWKPVRGFEGRYEVSDLGRVRTWVRAPGVRLASPRPLVGSLDRYGYRKILLQDAPRRETRLLHALVAEAFLGPRPAGMQVNHRDGVKSNNAAANLEWVTCLENHQHASRTGLKAFGSRNAFSTLDHGRLLEALEKYSAGDVSIQEAARVGCCSSSRLSGIIAGHGWRGWFTKDLLKRCRRVSHRRQRHA